MPPFWRGSSLMKRFLRAFNFRWGIVILMLMLLMFAALGVFVSLQTERLPPILILPPSFRRPVPLRNRIDQWIPRWFWAWRVERAVFGPRKPVNLFADIV